MPKVICGCTSCKFNDAEDKDVNGKCNFNGYIDLVLDGENTLDCKKFEWRKDE